MTAEAQRHFPYEGVFNFRDAGGYRAADGRQVRRRRLFRSDAVHRMTEADAARARKELGVVNVLDLRRDDEVQRDGVGLGPLLQSPTRHHRFSILPMLDRPGGVTAALDEEHGRGPSGGRYMAYLDMGAREFAGAVELLANEASYPALIHCTAGKDRTGVLVALLLNVLGVDDDTIVGDYELSNRSTQMLVEAGRIPNDASPEDLQRYYGAPPEAMTTFLQRLGEQFGSAQGYLTSRGVSDDALDRIRAALLEPAG